jgi:hypothetical protein
MMYRGDDDRCNGCGSDPCTNSTPQCPGGGGFRFRRLAILAGVGALVVLATGSSCLPPDPCTQIPPPSPEAVKVTEDPRYEVDYVIDDHTECDLVGNHWERETE